MVYQKSPPQNFSRRTLNVPSLLTVLRESHTILSRVFLQHTVILEPVLLLLLSAYIENRQGANRVVIVTAKCSFSSSPTLCFEMSFYADISCEPICYSECTKDGTVIKNWFAEHVQELNPNF